MVIPPTRACPGGLGSPVLAGKPGEVTKCPVCGAEVTLGYGGRVPVHDSASLESDRPVAGGN